MAKGVHNATSGYRRGTGKNGGGPPGQPNNRTQKKNFKYGSSRATANYRQKKNRANRGVNRIKAAGVLAVAGIAVYGGTRASTTSLGMDYASQRRRAQRAHYVSNWGLPSINIPKASRSGVYKITNTARPRRGYR